MGFDFLKFLGAVVTNRKITPTLHISLTFTHKESLDG